MICPLDDPDLQGCGIPLRPWATALNVRVVAPSWHRVRAPDRRPCGRLHRSAELDAFSV
jgi:hypothetical protein